MNARTVETTVTYLAMSARPARFPPMPTSPRLALMKTERIPLHFYRYLYATIGADWLWVQRLDMSDKALARAVQRESVEITVLYANGAPAGFYEIDFSTPESPNLAYFGIMPEWTGVKIGPWLLGCAIRDAFSPSATQVTVNTCTCDHPAALPLYQRLGFQPYRQERRVVSVPPQMRIPSHITARIGR